MNADQRRRLIEIEAAVARLRPGGVIELRKAAHLISDQECVTEWHKICHAPVGPHPMPYGEHELNGILGEWRRLAAHACRSEP